jgi:hypothetical protein
MMTTTEGHDAMEELFASVVDHATASRTELDPRIAVVKGAGMATVTIVASGMIPATEEAVVTAQRILPPDALTATVREPSKRTAQRAKTARCALILILTEYIPFPQLTQSRYRSQLSLHRPKPKRRRRKRLSDYANSKP